MFSYPYSKMQCQTYTVKALGFRNLPDFKRNCPLKIHNLNSAGRNLQGSGELFLVIGREVDWTLTQAI